MELQKKKNDLKHYPEHKADALLCLKSAFENQTFIAYILQIYLKFKSKLNKYWKKLVI